MAKGLPTFLQIIPKTFYRKLAGSLFDEGEATGDTLEQCCGSATIQLLHSPQCGTMLHTYTCHYLHGSSHASQSILITGYDPSSSQVYKGPSFPSSHRSFLSLNTSRPQPFL